MPQSIALEGLTILDGGLPGANVVDFIFLHGLNGSPKGTWTYQNGNDDVPDGFFWPGQLLVDIPGSRVMTFGYNALFERALVQNTATINDIAQTLISQLVANRRGPDYVDRPLVFIAHSLGGLVIKRALWNIHRDRSSGQTPTPRRIKEQNAIYDSVAGIVFMGTPHSGSHVTNTARVKVLKAIARATFKKVPENLINALAAHSFELQELSQNFENTTIFTQHIIEICTYYETKTQKFLGEEVVPREMTILHYQNERPEPIPNEHTKMIKFESANDSLYKSVCDRLKEMATDGMEARAARQVTYRILQIPGTIRRVEASRFLSTCGDGALGRPSNIRVHSLASRVGQAPSSKTATVTFVQVPRVLLEHRKSKERRWSIPFEHGGCHKAITVDVQGTFHGFTFLNDVQPEKHSLDIIALPGLGYDPFRSWQDMAASDASMWLRDQLPELVPGAQVALYGYDIDFESQQKNVSIQNIAISLIAGLRGIGRSAPSAKPVVFLAHSLGGAVLKQCLIELANTGQSELYMLQQVKTCIFMAVPNCLPDPSELAAIATGQGLEQLLKELQAAKNVRYFEAVSGMLRGIALANGIRMCSGFETMESILPWPKKEYWINEHPEPHINIKENQKSAILLQKNQSIQEVSRESDQFPISKVHREVVALEPGNQVIDTIATYIRDSIPSRSVPVVVSNEPPIPEANTWKNPLAGILSYLGGARAEASNTRQKPSTADISRSIESDHDGISSLYERFLSTFMNHGLEREEGISEAYRGTFEWIWTNQEVGFPAWINNDQPLFWIKGKPGSGKSTIMRYIWDHRNLSALIDSGTTERPRIKAAFFFYYRGTHLQKSFEGMLHTILLRLLTLEPRLADILLPDYAKLDHEQKLHFTWTLPKLMKAYKDIITQNAFPVDIFLFVDALDEYDGPPEAIVEFIQVSVQMSQQGSTTLKVCFSSREWEEFEQNFSRGPGFRIHEHTKADIDRYITSRLSNDPEISDMLNRGSEWKRSDIQDIEDTLARRANGVFIWVRAVLDEIHCLFSRNTPMSDLLEYLKGVPTDLEHLYADSIRRLPHEYRREAYFMFEVMLRSDSQLKAISLQQIVFCARHQGFDDCVRVVMDNQSFDKASRWINERGAGLVEIDHINGNLESTAVVRFIHQTVLDFVARPGFRALMFGNAFELPKENGHSLMSKWELAIIAVLTNALQATSAEQDVLEDVRAQILTYHDVISSTPPSHLTLAEQTTGRSMREFLGKVDARVLRRDLADLGYPEANIVNPLCAFSAVHGLRILLEEISLEDMGRIPDSEEVSILHYLCTLVIKRAIWTHIDDIFQLVHDTENVAATAAVVLGHGARLNAQYQNDTPWKVLFKGHRYSKFHGAGGDFEEDHQKNALVRVMLHQGQDPDEEIRHLFKRIRGKTPHPIVKALHLATRDLAEILLSYGAKVNAVCERGRTPLDLACGVGGKLFELGDHVRPGEAYALASLLVSYGAKLTREGQRLWPDFLRRLVSLAPELEASFSEAFKNPGVVHGSMGKVLVIKAKRLKDRVTKRQYSE